MAGFVRKAILAVCVFSVVMFLSGCTNWKKEYQKLNVEHQNLKGLYENCNAGLESSGAEKAELSARLAEGEKTIAELRSQIESGQQTAGSASGFGDEYDVAFDAAAGTVTVTLPDTILFASGKAGLKSATNADLNHIVEVIQSKYSNSVIDVIGHTDSDPIKKSGWADNWELSAERALSVLRYLNQQGIPAEQLRAVARGESTPIADNSSASGKAKNRRVEIVVHMRKV